jgi:hypothetical protein
MKMGVAEPGPEQAQAALAEAAAAREQVVGSDRAFAPRLLALAAATVCLAALLVVFTQLPAWTGPLQGILAGLGLAAAVVLVASAQLRQHAYTRAGNRLFVAILLVWIIWGEAVLQFSLHSGWLDHRMPHLIRDLHFIAGAVLGVLPLLIGAVLFWRRR